LTATTAVPPDAGCCAEAPSGGGEVGSVGKVVGTQGSKYPGVD
jgi:hypothetical protein